MLMSPDSSEASMSTGSVSVNKLIGQTSVIRIQVAECSQSQRVTVSPIYRGGQTSSVNLLPQNSVIFLNKSVPSRVVASDVLEIRQSQDKRLQPLPPPSPKLCTESASFQQHQRRQSVDKSFPVMDTTVASSMKGEPELNIGM